MKSAWKSLKKLLKCTKIVFTFPDGGIGFGEAHHSNPIFMPFPKWYSTYSAHLTLILSLFFRRVCSVGRRSIIVCSKPFKTLLSQKILNLQTFSLMKSIRRLDLFLYPNKKCYKLTPKMHRNTFSLFAQKIFC